MRQIGGGRERESRHSYTQFMVIFALANWDKKMDAIKRKYKKNSSISGMSNIGCFNVKQQQQQQILTQTHAESI